MKNSTRLKNAALCFWLEWIRPALVIAAIVFPLKSAVADWNWVPSGSMKPTILEGDLVLVNKLAYDFKVPFTLLRVAKWGDPEAGDIVVFFSPKDGTRLVKRIIGVPGDTLEMRNNVLFRNGAPLDYEVVLEHPFADELFEDTHPLVAQERADWGAHWVLALPSRPARRSFPPLTVPEGKYFVMGDSRDNSFDSRFFGFVDREQIVGEARAVGLSFNKNNHYAPRFNRFLSSLRDNP